MTRRTMAAAATGLAVLMLLAGVRWAISRPAAPVVQWREPPIAATHPAVPTLVPTATYAPPTTPPAAMPSAVTPSRSASSPPTVRPTRSAPPSNPPASPTQGPMELQRTTGGKKVAFTFDDGPHPDWTPKILQELKRAGVRATFCVLGSQVKRYPHLVAQIVREGHTLCNHSWNHEFELGTLPEAKIRTNLERTNQEIRRAAPGAEIHYFRHPGGKWTPAAIKVARELGMTSLHWTVDPRDWERPGGDVIADRVMSNAKPGAIVLLHDGGGDRSGTVAACRQILPALKEKYGVVLLK